MKMLSQLQADIRRVNAELEEISRGMAALQQSVGRDRPIDFCKIQALGMRYPIVNHCLGSQPEAVQHLYLVVLAGLLLAEPAHAEDGWLLLQRIAAGGGVTRPLTDFQVDAATLTPEQMDRFSAEISHAGLTDPLLLDGLLLCLAIQGGRSAWDYLSGLVELMGCPEERLKKLTALAASVANQNQNRLIELLNQSGELNLSQLLHWAVDVCQGPVLLHPGPRQVWLEGDGKMPIPSELYRAVKAENWDSLIIRNACFSGYAVEWAGSLTERLVLENCTFQSIEAPQYSSYCFRCEGFKQAEIRDCVFQKLSAGDYTIYVRSVRELDISDTVFREISSGMGNGWTMNVDAVTAQFENVAMEEIRGGFWYRGDNQHKAINCTYHDCSGRTSGLPDGFQEV